MGVLKCSVKLRNDITSLQTGVRYECYAVLYLAMSFVYEKSIQCHGKSFSITEKGKEKETGGNRVCVINHSQVHCIY